MKVTGKLLSGFLVLFLLLVPAQSAAAKGLFDGPVIFGGSYVLQSGETLDGDVVIFGGVATIEEGARVNGDVVLMGGSLLLDGEVNGNVVVVGGVVSLGEHSLVRGDLATIGASLQRADGSRVEGNIIYNATGFRSDEKPFVPPVPAIPRVVVNANPIWPILGVLGRALVLGLVAMLVVMFLPEPTRRVAQAAVDQPVVAGGLGLLTIVILPLAIVVLALTIILSPVALITVLVLVVAILYGWIGLGLEVGERFTKMLDQEWPLPLTAGFGTLLLTLVSDGIGLIPCIGWLAPFIIAMLAIGGVIMTRFGSQVVLPPAMVVPAPPAGPDAATE
ncbi:MAG: hypothetical protein GXP40_01650 [Chloroflexi bacterium]|nr:hypothetical protein [Chloroflexota bacterium]